MGLGWQLLKTEPNRTETEFSSLFWVCVLKFLRRPKPKTPLVSHSIIGPIDKEKNKIEN